MKDKGFSLIELMVVVAIIGTLAGLILANLSTTRRITRDRRRVVDISTIKSAIEAYLADENPFIKGNDDNCDGDFVSFLIPEYLPASPVDPFGSCDAVGSFYPYYYYGGFGGSVNTPHIRGCPRPFYYLYAHLETDGIGEAINDDSCNTMSDPTGLQAHENDNRAYVVVGRGR